MEDNFKRAFSFLAIGKTQQSKEAGESGFKRYVGLGSSFVLAVNPKKDKLDELMGYESKNEPEYIKEGENGKEAYVNFIVRTDPETNNGIEITNRLMFTLRQVPAYSKDQTKVQVIDKYGNHTWMNTEDAKAGKPAMRSDGNPNKLDVKYRMACVGECDLIDFLKAYLCVPDAFNYVNGTWVKKENADDFVFALEHIKDYFNGNFSELADAIAIQPNNKVKLLYGVQTKDDGKQYQAIASRGDLILPNNAGMKLISRLEKNLANAKQNGAYSNTDYRIQELQEYTVEPTNLEKPSDSDLPFDAPSDSAMPWD